MGRGARGTRGMIKAFSPPRRGRSRYRDGFMNGFEPIRMGMGRPRPYLDMRGGKRGRGGAVGPPPLPPSMCFWEPYPRMHRRGTFPPPPRGHPGCRGLPSVPRRGMMPPCSPRHFHTRGYHSGPPPPPPRLPPGRGQRWPGPPGGRRF